MKAVDPRARRQIVEDWLAVAEESRRVAAACLASDHRWEAPPASLPASDGKAFERISDPRRQAIRQDAFAIPPRYIEGHQVPEDQRTRRGCERLERLGIRVPLSKPLPDEDD